MGPVDGDRYRRLLTDRNTAWAATIDGLLADNDEAMIIVGAGHLVGDDGVPALLADRGFTVERISGTAEPVIAPPVPAIRRR